MEPEHIFNYTPTGFEITSSNISYPINWSDIERIRAYKVDMMTVDEIRMDIVFDNNWITITEETPGWDQFIERMMLALPVNNEEWYKKVTCSPLETNLTIIYEWSNWVMPEKSNFFSAIHTKTKAQVADAFQILGWTIHKSTLDNYELKNNWTYLTLDDDNDNLLLHGLIAYYRDNVRRITEIFDGLNCPYVIEFYNDKMELIEEYKSP